MKKSTLGILTGCLILSATVDKAMRPLLGDDVYDRLAISNPDTMSAASKRALARNCDQGPEWFCDFRLHNLRGDFRYEEGVIRRDPSSVIQVDGTYYRGFPI